MKAHTFMWQGCFFFYFYLATSTTNWVQIFTGLLICAYVEIHQVRRLVLETFFDNYQKLQVFLSATILLKKSKDSSSTWLPESVSVLLLLPRPLVRLWIEGASKSFSGDIRAYLTKAWMSLLMVWRYSNWKARLWWTRHASTNCFLSYKDRRNKSWELRPSSLQR